jgi:hypothetical protein
VYCTITHFVSGHGCAVGAYEEFILRSLSIRLRMALEIGSHVNGDGMFNLRRWIMWTSKCEEWTGGFVSHSALHTYTHCESMSG